jgi:hypothetical protein
MVGLGVLDFARFSLMLRQQYPCRAESLLAAWLDAGAYAELVGLSSARLTFLPTASNKMVRERITAT